MKIYSRQMISILLILSMIFVMLPVSTVAEDLHTVTFHDDDGSVIGTQTVPSGELATPPELPEHTDETFGGWFTEESYITPWNPTTDIIEKDLSVYARWFRSQDFTYSLTAEGTIKITGYTGTDVRVIIPELIDSKPVTHIAQSTFTENTTVQSIHLSKNVLQFQSQRVDGHSPTTLTAIHVDSRNAVYASVEGILYDRATSGLVLYPYGKAGAFTVPTGTPAILDSAFASCISLTELTIPASVKSIALNAFAGCITLAKVWHFGAELADPGTVFHDVAADFLLYYRNWVTFNPNHPDDPAPLPTTKVAAERNTILPVPDALMRNDLIFAGWCTDEARTKTWDFDTDLVTADLTLYAHWIPFVGAGTREDPYLIEKPGQLTHLFNQPELQNKVFKQVHDLDLSAYVDYPSITFSGMFDGNQHTISGLKINANSDAGDISVGLFGKNEGIIQNIHLKDAEILVAVSKNIVYVGGIAGYNHGQIENCTFSGLIKITGETNALPGVLFAGGIAGYNSQYDILNCENNGTIDLVAITPRENLTAFLGGIAGQNVGYLIDETTKEVTMSTIAHSVNTGAIHASGITSSTIGGIVGMNYSDVSACFNIADLSLKLDSDTLASELTVGGITGISYEESRIWNAYNIGDLSATASTNAEESQTAVGGIVGQIGFSKIEDCFNTGHIESIAATPFAGGIIGTVIEDVVGVYQEAYYLDTIPAGAGSGELEGIHSLPKTGLSFESTYAGFDFENDWAMTGDPSNTLPELVGTRFKNRSRSFTYINWDESVCKTESVPYSSFASAAAGPVRQNYEFSGWSPDNTSETAFEFATTPVISDITVYARYVYSPPLVISSNTLTIDLPQSLITGLAVGTTIRSLLNQLNNDQNLLSVYNAFGEVLTNFDQSLATGMIINLVFNNEVRHQLTIAIKGDITRDAEISALDLLLLKKHLLGQVTLHGAPASAARVTGNTDISALDLLMIKKHLLNQVVIQ